MRSRERLLLTLNHKNPDRIPWWALVNTYFLYAQKGKYRNMDSLGFLREMGADMYYWIDLPKNCSKSKDVAVKTYIDGKLIDTDYSGRWITIFYDYFQNTEYFGGAKEKVIEKEIITPLGELSTEFKYTPSSGTVFISKYLIKNVEDYKIFTFMIENLEYQDLEKFYQEKEKEVGEDSIVVAGLHSSPVYELIQCFMGLERVHYFFNDNKNETIELIEIMFDKYVQAYMKYSRIDSVNAVVIPEDAGTTLYSPKFFNTYLKPALKAYCRIIKESGKIAGMHACGLLKYITDSLKEIDLDYIESVSPPPIGNVNIFEFKNALENVCLMGGIHANAWSFELDNFKKYVKGLIVENKEGGNFILSSADTVPANAKVDNIKAIPELVDKYGRY